MTQLPGPQTIVITEETVMGRVVVVRFITTTRPRAAKVLEIVTRRAADPGSCTLLCSNYPPKRAQSVGKRNRTSAGPNSPVETQ